MKDVSLSEAQARLSQIDDAAKVDHATIIVSCEEWQQFTDTASLWDLLTNAPVGGHELERSRSPMRQHEF